MTAISNPMLLELSRPEVLTDSDRQLKLLECVRNQLNSNLVDASDIISPLVKLVASNNSSVKTQVCDLVIQVSAEEPDIGLLVVNILNKDLTDPNPIVRSTAIATICSLPILTSHVEGAVTTGLTDSNPGVRVSAVTGVGRLWRHSPDTCADLGLVNTLYTMLRDHDPTVVTFTLQTLSVILENEGGIKVNKKMVRYLLTKVVTYREKEFCYVVEYLHVPDSDEELILETLNTLDSFLDHADGNVMLSVAKLFVKIVQDFHSLKSSLVKRVIPVFTGYLTRSNREFNHVLLDFIDSLDQDYVYAMVPHIKVLFPKPKDPEKLKLRKVKFLPKLVNEENAMETLNFFLNFLPQSEELNREMFKAIANICKSESSCYSHGIVNLEMLLKSDADKYMENILVTVKLFELEKHLEVDTEQRIPQFVKTLFSKLKTTSLTKEHLSSVLYLLEHFSSCDVEDSPYVIEDILELDKSSWSPILYCQLLSSSYQIFLSQPAAMQITMGLVLHECLQVQNQLLHETVMFYYDLLKQFKFSPRQLE